MWRQKPGAYILLLQVLQKKLAALIAAGAPHLADLAEEYDTITSSSDATTDQQQLSRRHDLAPKHKGSSSTAAATAGSDISTAHGTASEAAETSREAFLAEALDDAESAVALLQAKLLEATQQQQLAAARLADMQSRAAQAAVRHNQQLAAAKQAGQVQLAALQEAVTRLGHRGELAGQVRLFNSGPCCLLLEAPSASLAGQMYCSNLCFVVMQVAVGWD